MLTQKTKIGFRSPRSISPCNCPCSSEKKIRKNEKKNEKKIRQNQDVLLVRYVFRQLVVSFYCIKLRTTR